MGRDAPWSTGKVGMYGKSCDGFTGLVGAVSKPQGLAAVVSQEPVYDLYRYLYSERVRYVSSVATPAPYDVIAETPGRLLDDPNYNKNGLDDLARPRCPALNWLDQQSGDHESGYLSTVTVRSASLASPWLRKQRTSDLMGGRAVRLVEYLAAAPFHRRSRRARRRASPCRRRRRRSSDALDQRARAQPAAAAHGDRPSS